MLPQKSCKSRYFLFQFCNQEVVGQRGWGVRCAVCGRWTRSVTCSLCIGGSDLNVDKNWVSHSGSLEQGFDVLVVGKRRSCTKDTGSSHFWQFGENRRNGWVHDSPSKEQDIGFVQYENFQFRYIDNIVSRQDIFYSSWSPNYNVTGVPLKCLEVLLDRPMVATGTGTCTTH